MRFWPTLYMPASCIKQTFARNATQIAIFLNVPVLLLSVISYLEYLTEFVRVTPGQ